MSEQLSFDRRNGFVALPLGVMDLDLSPGAFRTLVELCRMANADGFCWPSLGHLSDRLGRSRSAISGYVAELRAAGVLVTHEQRTANGYNYRLKYEIPFWAEWRASLTGVAKSTERRVRQDERIRDSENQSQENQDQGKECMAEFPTLLREWARVFAGAPYPAATKAPDPGLVARTEAALAGPPPRPADPQELRDGLAACWRRLRVPADAGAVSAQAAALLRRGLSAAECAAFLGRLEQDWPAHWRRAPCPESFGKRVDAATRAAAATQATVLRSHLRRWALAQSSLRKPAARCSLEQRQAGARTPEYPRI